MEAAVVLRSHSRVSGGYLALFTGMTVSKGLPAATGLRRTENAQPSASFAEKRPGLGWPRFADCHPAVHDS